MKKKHKKMKRRRGEKMAGRPHRRGRTSAAAGPFAGQTTPLHDGPKVKTVEVNAAEFFAAATDEEMVAVEQRREAVNCAAMKLVALVINGGCSETEFSNAMQIQIGAVNDLQAIYGALAARVDDPAMRH